MITVGSSSETERRRVWTVRPWNSWFGTIEIMKPTCRPQKVWSQNWLGTSVRSGYAWIGGLDLFSALCSRILLQSACEESTQYLAGCEILRFGCLRNVSWPCKGDVNETQIYGNFKVKYFTAMIRVCERKNIIAFW